MATDSTLLHIISEVTRFLFMLATRAGVRELYCHLPVVSALYNEYIFLYVVWFSLAISNAKAFPRVCGGENIRTAVNV